MFVKLVNAGRKLGHQLRMWQQSEPSVIFDRIISAWIASPALVAPAANLPPPVPIYFSVWINLSSYCNPTLTSNHTIASSQAYSSQYISFEDPRQGRETIFELHLRCELSKKISRCCGICHKPITQFDRLLVRSYGVCSWLDPKTGRKQSSHGPL